MDRSAIFDPLGLEQFLFQATQSTSLTSPSVVDTLANFFVGSPNRRHLLSLVNEKVYGSTHHINKMEQELEKRQQLCTPEEAVKLVVDLRVPRRRYPILQKFITPFGQAFRHTTGVRWYPQLPSREKFSGGMDSSSGPYAVGSRGHLPGTRGYWYFMATPESPRLYCWATNFSQGLGPFAASIPYSPWGCIPHCRNQLEPNQYYYGKFRGHGPQPIPYIHHINCLYW